MTSIAYGVYAVSDGSEVDTGSLAVASTIFDTLQTDAVWTRDSTGYNFKWSCPGSLVPTGGVHYRFEVTITPASGNAFVVVWDVETEEIYGS